MQLNSLRINELKSGDLVYITCGDEVYKFGKSGIKCFNVTGGWFKQDIWDLSGVASICFAPYHVNIKNMIVVGCEIQFILANNEGTISPNSFVTALEVLNNEQ